MTHTDDPARARLSLSLSLACVLRILSPGSFVRAMYSSFVPHVGQIVLRQNSERERECWRVQVVEMDILTDMFFFCFGIRLGMEVSVHRPVPRGLEVYGRRQSRRCIPHRRSQRGTFCRPSTRRLRNGRMYRLHEPHAHSRPSSSAASPSTMRSNPTRARTNSTSSVACSPGPQRRTWCFSPTLVRLVRPTASQTCDCSFGVPKALPNSSKCNSWIH